MTADTKLANALALLKKHQWASWDEWGSGREDEDGHCPECDGCPKEGHTTTCELAALIAESALSEPMLFIGQFRSSHLLWMGAKVPDGNLMLLRLYFRAEPRDLPVDPPAMAAIAAHESPACEFAIYGDGPLSNGDPDATIGGKTRREWNPGYLYLTRITQVVCVECRCSKAIPSVN